jgi:amidase
VVQVLLDAGAELVGKTHTDELTYSLNGENAHYGTPVNVNAPGRIPGGSSSGSASAVAGGLVDFALGSDTGGSVRAPASFCGIYGMRPTHGSVSLVGARPLAASFDTCGWFARDPALLEKVGMVLLGSSAASQPGKLLKAEDAFGIAGSVVGGALQPALERIESQFGKVQTVTVSEQSLAQWFQIFRVLQGAEAWAEHGEWITRVKPKLGPGVKERIAWAATIPADEIDAAKKKREHIKHHMNKLLDDNAVLVLPTLPDIAPRLNTPPAELDDFRSHAMSLLCIAGLARLPQLSLPLGRVNDCPVGISLVAGRGGDTMLLALARTLATAA